MEDNNRNWRNQSQRSNRNWRQDRDRSWRGNEDQNRDRGFRGNEERRENYGSYGNVGYGAYNSDYGTGHGDDSHYNRNFDEMNKRQNTGGSWNNQQGRENDWGWNQDQQWRRESNESMSDWNRRNISRNLNDDYGSDYGSGYGNRSSNQYGSHGSYGSNTGSNYNRGNMGNMRGNYGNRSQVGHNYEGEFGDARNRGERDWWERTKDEVSSWFGDDDAERRRQMDRGYKGKGPKDYQRSEDRIREDVCDRLSDDDMLDATNVQVQVTGNEVTLTGTVENRDQKRRAEDVVESISGVRNVENRIRVSPREERIP